MPEAQSILEPFAGVGTTPLTLGLMGVRSFYSEINPAMRKVINAKLQIASLPKSKKQQVYKDILELADNCSSTVSD